MNKVTLNTQTTITREGAGIDIFTFYSGSTRSISAFISESVTSIQGINFIEGELGFVITNWPNITFKLNDKGELIVVGDEAEKFSITETGDLIYTT